MVFTFELENISKATLAYSGWPGIGGQLAGGVSPGGKRKFRANGDQLQAAVGHLEKAAAAGSIRLTLLSPLTPAHAQFLRELQAEVLDDLLDGVSQTAGQRLFISHAAGDRGLAKHVAQELCRRMEGAVAFVASRTGDIPAGDEWYEIIKTKLKEADVYVVLLTPRSIERPWVIFETGAAWMSERQVVPVTAGGLAPHDVQPPLSFRQVYSLENEEESKHVLEVLQADTDGVNEFCAGVRAAATQSAIGDIEGLEFDEGAYFGPS